MSFWQQSCTAVIPLQLQQYFFEEKDAAFLSKFLMKPFRKIREKSTILPQFSILPGISRGRRGSPIRI